MDGILVTRSPCIFADLIVILKRDHILRYSRAMDHSSMLRATSSERFISGMTIEHDARS
jgi:hypothetical protein